MSNMQLTPISFHILLSLVRSELHGYEIIKEVEINSDGRIHLLTGTLYNSLKRLLEEGLIKETRTDERRRYYRATKAGQELVSAELERYSFVLNLTHNLGGKNAS